MNMYGSCLEWTSGAASASAAARGGREPLIGTKKKAGESRPFGMHAPPMSTATNETGSVHRGFVERAAHGWGEPVRRHHRLGKNRLQPIRIHGLELEQLPGQRLDRGTLPLDDLP